jgi:hypothetical protein
VDPARTFLLFAKFEGEREREREREREEIRELSVIDCSV